jgi:hypothetical protein
MMRQERNASDSTTGIGMKSSIAAFGIPLICYLLVIPGWVKSLLGLGHSEIYAVLYAVLVSLAVTSFLNRIENMPWLLVILSGLFVGQLVAMVVVLGYMMAIPDGPHRLANSIDKFGFVVDIAAHTLGSFALGGWLLGGVLFALAKLMQHRERKLGDA